MSRSKERPQLPYAIGSLSATIATCGLPEDREIARRGPWEAESRGSNWRTVLNHWPIIAELSRNSLTQEALAQTLKGKLNLPIDPETVAFRLGGLQKIGLCGKEFIGADEVWYLTPKAFECIQPFRQIPGGAIPTSFKRK